MHGPLIAANLPVTDDGPANYAFDPKCGSTTFLARFYRVRDDLSNTDFHICARRYNAAIRPTRSPPNPQQRIVQRLRPARGDQMPALDPQAAPS